MPEKIKGIKDEKYLENFSKAIPSTFITSETKNLLKFASMGYIPHYSNILKNYKIKRTRDYNCVLLIFSPIVVAAQAIINIDATSETLKKSDLSDLIDLIDSILESAKFKLLCTYIGAGEGSKISGLLRKFPEYKRLFVFFSSETKYTELIKRAQNISGWRTNGNYIKTKLIPFINHVIGQKFGDAINSSMQKQERISDEDAFEIYATPEQEQAMYVFKLITTEFKKYKLENIVLKSPISGSKPSETTNYQGHTNKFNIFTDITNDKFNVWFDKEELTSHYNVNKTQLLEDVITYCDLIREGASLTPLPKPKGDISEDETPPALPPRGTRPSSKQPVVAQLNTDIKTNEKTKQPPPPPLRKPPTLPFNATQLLNHQPGNLNEKANAAREKDEEALSDLKNKTQESWELFNQLVDWAKNKMALPKYLLGIDVAYTVDSEMTCPFLENMNFYYRIKPAKDKAVDWRRTTSIAENVKLFIIFKEDNLKERKFETHKQNIEKLIKYFAEILTTIEKEKEEIPQFKKTSIQFEYKPQSGRESPFIVVSKGSTIINCLRLFDKEFDKKFDTNDKLKEDQIKKVKEWLQNQVQHKDDEMGEHLKNVIQQKEDDSQQSSRTSDFLSESEIAAAVSPEDDSKIQEIIKKFKCTEETAKQLQNFYMTKYTDDDISKLVCLIQKHKYTLEKAEEILNSYNDNIKKGGGSELADINVFVRVYEEKVNRRLANLEDALKALKSREALSDYEREKNPNRTQDITKQADTDFNSITRWFGMSHFDEVIGKILEIAREEEKCTIKKASAIYKIMKGLNKDKDDAKKIYEKTTEKIEKAKEDVMFFEDFSECLKKHKPGTDSLDTLCDLVKRIVRDGYTLTRSCTMLLDVLKTNPDPSTKDIAGYIEKQKKMGEDIAAAVIQRGKKINSDSDDESSDSDDDW